MNAKLLFVLLILTTSLLGRAQHGERNEIIILQLNDLYELVPLQLGRYGGLARVATLQQRLKGESPHQLTIVAGDFLSPSAIGTSSIDGKRIAGAHMVDVLNAVGVSHVTFGNHEFDIRPEELDARINESQFRWISSNVKRIAGDSVVSFSYRQGGITHPVPEYGIITMNFPAGDGSVRKTRIGLIGLTIDSNPRSYLVYENPIESAKRVVAAIKNNVDYLIAITHLDIDQDIALAKAVPDIRLILGGHEHTNMNVRVGSTVITKADANAKTAYIHRLLIGQDTPEVELRSELIIIDESIAEDSVTARAADRWISRAYAGFRSMGLDPDLVVATLSTPLDARETVIRHQPADAGRTIAAAILAASPGADCAIVNSGSIRIDDVLAGTITQYDVIRTLPFGGKILTARIRGALLERVLKTGLGNKGSGGYLQWMNIDYNTRSGAWTVNAKPLDPGKTYTVVLTDFLLTGAEANLDFLNADNPEISDITEPPGLVPNDIRRAVINYFKAGR